MQMGGAKQNHNAEGGREAKKFKNHCSMQYILCTVTYGGPYVK